MASYHNHCNRPIDRKYLTIGQLAKELGVATSLLRFYETEHDCLRPLRAKTRKKTRKYNHKQQSIARKIHELVAGQGYTHWGARKAMEA